MLSKISLLHPGQVREEGGVGGAEEGDVEEDLLELESCRTNPVNDFRHLQFPLLR